MTFTSLTSAHWPDVSRIYQEGIATNNATFQTTAPSWEEWDATHVRSSRIVALIDNEVAGWAALTPVSGRCVYAGVGEVSVYVAEHARGKGLGKALLNELIKESEADGFWTLTAGVFPENEASLRIHQQAGFKVLGVRERIGKLSFTVSTDILLQSW